MAESLSDQRLTYPELAHRHHFLLGVGAPLVKVALHHVHVVGQRFQVVVSAVAPRPARWRAVVQLAGRRRPDGTAGQHPRRQPGAGRRRGSAGAGALTFPCRRGCPCRECAGSCPGPAHRVGQQARSGGGDEPASASTRRGDGRAAAAHTVQSEGGSTPHAVPRWRWDGPGTGVGATSGRRTRSFLNLAGTALARCGTCRSPSTRTSCNRDEKASSQKHQVVKNCDIRYNTKFISFKECNREVQAGEPGGAAGSTALFRPGTGAARGHCHVCSPGTTRVANPRNHRQAVGGRTHHHRRDALERSLLQY